MKLHLIVASASHATAVCMRASGDVQDLSDRRSAAFRDWVARLTCPVGPAEESQEFPADGSFARFGPCIGIQANAFMNSDLGPCPGQHGFVFPENDSDHGGWENSYTWAELLNITAGAIWCMGWRYTYPDDPDQWPQSMSEDVVNQIGGRAHLEIV